jgi:hypothetical protein
VSMADLIAKVSRSNTNWKDPGVSRTQGTSNITSGHHDTQPEFNRRPKPSNLKSHNSSSTSSEVQLDDTLYAVESAPSRATGLEVNMSSEVRIHVERRKSLGASTKEGSELELGNVVSLMGEDTEPLEAEDRRGPRETTQRSGAEKGMGVHTTIWGS